MLMALICNGVFICLFEVISMHLENANIIAELIDHFSYNQKHQLEKRIQLVMILCRYLNRIKF